MKYLGILAVLAALAGCGDSKADYKASERCQAMGHAPGSPGFEQCVKEERAVRMLEQQRKEFERMKRERQDERMYREFQ